jgi:hypothetical protein
LHQPWRTLGEGSPWSRQSAFLGYMRVLESF